MFTSNAVGVFYSPIQLGCCKLDEKLLSGAKKFKLTFHSYLFYIKGSFSGRIVKVQMSLNARLG